MNWNDPKVIEGLREMAARDLQIKAIAKGLGIKLNCPTCGLKNKLTENKIVGGGIFACPKYVPVYKPEHYHILIIAEHGESHE